MKNCLQLSYLLIVFAVCSFLICCTTAIKGPQINGCMYDYPRNGFDCYSKIEGNLFIPIEKATDFECMSGRDFGSFIKACRNHQILIVTTCYPNLLSKGFDCIDGNGVPTTFIPFNAAPPLFCYTTLDASQIMDRCKNANL